MKKILPLLLLAVSLSLFSADKNVFKQGRVTDFPQYGFKIRPFKSTPQLPNPAPDVCKLQSSDGKEIPAVSIHDIWQKTQIAAYFSGTGITICVYAPSLPSAKELKGLYQDYHTEQFFHEWAEKQKADFRPSEERVAWMSYLTGLAPDQISLSRDFSLKVTGKGTLEYIASIPPAEKTSWIVVSVRFTEIQDAKKTEKALKTLASSLAVYSPSKGAEPVKSKKSVALKDPQGAAYEESRKQVIASIRSVPGWWYMETPHFIIVSNIKRKKDLSFIQTEAERIRSLYETLMPPQQPIEAVSVIRVFDDREEYNHYLGHAVDWSAGVWLAHRKELVFFTDPQEKRQDRQDSIRRVLYHELFHQYLFYALGGNNAPPWFNEGLSQYYEDVEFKGKRPQLKFDKGERDRIQPVLERTIGHAETILALTNEEFQEQHRYSYTAVRAMMFFMMKCREKKYNRIPAEYFRVFSKSRDEKAAMDAAWNGIDRESFDRDFHAFWEGRESSKAMDDTGLPSWAEPQTK